LEISDILIIKCGDHAKCQLAKNPVTEWGLGEAASEGVGKVSPGDG